MLCDNATHALNNSLIANLEHGVNVRQPKPRAQILNKSKNFHSLPGPMQLCDFVYIVGKESRLICH
jgi:hypothetical protein